MKLKAPGDWDLEIWRAFREMGMDCTLIRAPEPNSLELMIESRTFDKGVRTTGPDKEWVKLMHREVIIGLSEVNPLWTEFNQKTPITKPKDMGTCIEGSHTVITICIGDRKEADRLMRCRSKLVRAIVHAHCHWALLKNRLL